MTRQMGPMRTRTDDERNLLSELPLASRLIIWSSVMALFAGAVAIAIWLPAYVLIAWGLLAVGLHTSFTMLRSRY